MGKVNALWQDQIENLELAFIEDIIDIDEFELAIENLVELDEIEFYRDAALEAKAEHGQFGVGA